MMKTRSLLLVIIALSVPASAQEVAPVQVAGGYSYLTKPNAVLVEVIQDERDDAPGSGWFADIIGNITPHAAIIGQISATYTRGTLNSKGWRGDDTAYSFLAGGRATWRRRIIVPFGQALIGWIRSDADLVRPDGVGSWADNYAAFVAGGGADIALRGNLGIHVAADVMGTSRGPHVNRTWRVQAGIIFPMQ